jgi:protein-tyrosine phosphatase
MWIDLDGAVNARDLGGLPLSSGARVAPHRLLRTDNLQDLTPRDVRLLVDEYGVDAVADLRTGAEIRSEGPGPLTGEPGVEFLHASFFAEESELPEVVGSDDGPIVLPWHNRRRDPSRRGAAQVYLGYLAGRPDSILAALRLIAHSPGATLVHCAAGKDRTGVLIALALDAVGVRREAIVEDFARTAERLPELLARLASSPTYSDEISVDQPDRHHPRASTMEDFLSGMDREFGGTRAWLASQGWTEADQRALQAKLTHGPVT